MVVGRSAKSQTNTCGTVRVGCVAANILCQARADAAPVALPPAVPAAGGIDDRLREVEAHLIRWALDSTHGNKSRAAALLNVKRSSLGDRIRHCGLEVDAVETEPKGSCEGVNASIA